MVDSLNKQLIGQMAINNIYIYIYLLFSDCMTPDGGKKRFWKLLVRAVMKIYNTSVFVFPFFVLVNCFQAKTIKKQ